MAAARRLELLGSIRGDVAVFGAAPVAMRSGDVEFEYRQDSDFVYLTAFPEPEAVAVLAPDHPSDRYVLFVQPRDPERERWEGPRAGIDGAVADYGADAAFPIDALAEKLTGYLEHGARLHYPLGRRPDLDSQVLGAFRRLLARRPRTGKGPTEIVDPAPVLHEMRLRKSDEEVAILRRAAAITAEGHLAAMRAARPGAHEYEVAALLEYTYKRLGATGSGYPPIVAAGANATVLHYRRNRDRLRAGDLLLIDSGAEYDHLTSDVTRTLPVSGRFSRPQRRIYDLVLEAQRAAIAEVRPGRSFRRAHDAAVEVLTRGLIKLKLVEGRLEDAIREQRYRRFYMHRTGHWLGMDVHDVGVYGEGDERLLEPGMVVTVEPGLYFPRGEEGADPTWSGIGVRIEDDVLVTRRGPEVLTGDIPKAPADLARARRRLG
jgi:Xaa-Pro aminopeptidase